jgi:hypothetical protein
MRSHELPRVPKSSNEFPLIQGGIRCVRQGGTPETVCTDNIRSLAMVFGAIESAEVERTVDIS